MRFRDQMERLYQDERENPLAEWAFRDGHRGDGGISSARSPIAPLLDDNAASLTAAQGRVHLISLLLFRIMLPYVDSDWARSTRPKRKA